jgi:hypothetical protein
VKTLPSMLTPFVRSDAVGAILAEVFLHPDLELSISEVARRAGVLPAVAHREIGRLVEAGVLTDRRDGNNRLVTVNRRHPLFAPMDEIIHATYGPVPVLRELLSGMAGIEEAFVYGSWAARRSGESGPFPADIDVMLVGDIDVDNLIGVEQAARERLGVVVNIHRSSAHAWHHRQGNPFLETVASRPMLPIDLTQARATDESSP